MRTITDNITLPNEMAACARAVEQWLRDEVVPTYGALKAVPPNIEIFSEQKFFSRAR